MKRISNITLSIISVILLLSSPAFGWKDKIVANQLKAAQYITLLQKGANPDKISRPKIRRDEKASAKAANRELRDAMDAAEKLARAGKHHLIKPPKFRRIVSEEQYQKKEKRRK